MWFPVSLRGVLITPVSQVPPITLGNYMICCASTCSRKVDQKEHWVTAKMLPGCITLGPS